VILGSHDDKFEIIIKHSDIVPFSEILNLDIFNVICDDLKLDLKLPKHVIRDMVTIYKKLYLSDASEQDTESVVSQPLEITLKSQDLFSFQPR